MSGATPQDPGRDLSVPATSDVHEIPTEFSAAYQRAYRRSLAEHPTEMMLSARPGKRAAKRSGLLVRVTDAMAAILLNQRARVALLGVGAAALVLLAFVAGRLAS